MKAKARKILMGYYEAINEANIGVWFELVDLKVKRVEDGGEDLLIIDTTENICRKFGKGRGYIGRQKTYRTFVYSLTAKELMDSEWRVIWRSA